MAVQVIRGPDETLSAVTLALSQRAKDARPNPNSDTAKRVRRW